MSRDHERPHVLLVAPYFPPRQRVGALRPYKWAAHLVELGHRVSVICLDSPGDALSATEERRLARVTVLRLPAGPDRTRAASGSFSQSPIEQRTTQRWTRRLAAALASPIDRAMPVDGWWPWLLATSPRALAFARTVRPQVVISTADPWSSHLLGWLLARSIATPWVADYRDPWTLCLVRNVGRPQLARDADAWVEAQLIAHADRSVFTAQRTTARYAEHYAQHAARFRTIPNGFDDTSLTQHLARQNTRSHATGPLEVLFFGRFRALSSATPIIEALARVRARAPDVIPLIRIRSMGPLDDSDRNRAQAAEVLSCFVETAPVPYSSAQARLLEADLLLLSTQPGRDEIIPAKLWDYLPAGRPILALTESAEVAAILQETGAGEQVTVEAGATRLIEAARAKADGRPLTLFHRPNPSVITQYSARAGAQALSALVSEVVREKT